MTAEGYSYALTCTPNTVELISTLGALLSRGGPVQDPVLTAIQTQPRQGCTRGGRIGSTGVQGYLTYKKTHPPRTLP